MRGMQLAAWIDFLSSAPHEVDQLLLSVCLEATVQACDEVIQAADGRSVAADFVSLICELCVEEFSSYQQRAVHMARKHATKRVARRYVLSRTCKICLKSIYQQVQAPGSPHRKVRDLYDEYSHTLCSISKG